MKVRFKKALFKAFVTLGFLLSLLIAIVCNPSLLYAKKSHVGNYIIYHNEALPEAVHERLAKVDEIIKNSDIYKENQKLTICLNDGSFYPRIINAVKGDAFAWGFDDKIVMWAKADFKQNTAHLHGYNWKLEELLAHEAIHCYQYMSLGFLNSNPIAAHPEWKWEGYAEYIARSKNDQLNTLHSSRTLLMESSDTKWGIDLNDSTIIPRVLLKDMIKVREELQSADNSFVKLIQAND